MGNGEEGEMEWEAGRKEVENGEKIEMGWNFVRWCCDLWAWKFCMILTVLKTCKTKFTVLIIFNYSHSYIHIAMNVNYIQ